MRKTNSKTKKDIWECKVVSCEGNILIEGQYKTIQEIADVLGLSYNQTRDYKQGGRCKKIGSKFKFQPQITIKRIGQTQKEIYDEKRNKKENTKENEKNEITTI